MGELIAEAITEVQLSPATALAAIRFTRFADVSGAHAKQFETSFEQFADDLCHRPKTFPSKQACPLLKLATFGSTRTDKGSLRHDANVLSVTGVEGDHDAGSMTLEEAALLLELAGVQAVLYTSASHTKELPRWRVLAFFSRERTPHERNKFAARLNGILRGALAPESFSLSQSFYFGRVEGAEYEAARIDGDSIDTRDELDAGAIGPKMNSDAVVAGQDDFSRAIALRSVTAETIKELRDAVLNGLSQKWADERPLWIKVAHALASLKVTPYADQALELWHEFSRRSSSKYKASEVESKWHDEFTPSKITYRSIFEWAQADSWQNPRRVQVEGTTQEVPIDELRREQQKKENEIIGEGSDSMPVAEITLQAALDRFVFLADGSRVADRLHPHYDLALQDFKNTYAASKSEVKQRAKVGVDGSVTQRPDKSIAVADLWCASPNRRTVVSRTFKAGAPEVLNDPRGRVALNLWKPFDRSVIVDDLHAAGIGLFLDQVQFLFGADTPRFLDWLAHIEQNPGQLPHTGWLHIAREFGLGRNWLASALSRVWAGSVAANFDLVFTLRTGFNERLSRKVLAIPPARNHWQELPT
jgi:hypothetical protein